MTSQYYATSVEDLLDPAVMRSMSGMEYLQGMVAGKFASPPMAGTANIKLTRIEGAEAEFRGAPKFRHCNPAEVVHGGWYGTVLDSAMGCAVMTAVPKGSVYTTLEYKVNIIRPAPLEQEVICIATLTHGGRSTGIATAEIRGSESGKLFATGSTTCIIMKMA